MERFDFIIDDNNISLYSNHYQNHNSIKKISLITDIDRVTNNFLHFIRNDIMSNTTVSRLAI